MKRFRATGLLLAISTFAGICSESWAEVCSRCNSDSCETCTVRVGVYGYTRPTWRPWPTAKEKKPGEREKTDRRLIRPEPFETPAPEMEADRGPNLTVPDRGLPDFEPLPPDDAPELPPQLRNKQPIPIQESSTRRRGSNRFARSSPVDDARSVTAATAPQRTERAGRRTQSTQPTKPAPRRVASLNIPVSAQLSLAKENSNNPLRLTGAPRLHARTAATLRRASANMPVAVRTMATEPSNTAPPVSNPLR